MRTNWKAVCLGIVMLSNGCAHRGATTSPDSHADRAIPISSAHASNADHGGESAALAHLMKAISGDDEPAVADALLMPIKLSREQLLLYSRRLILGSQLQWLVNEKFGAKPSRMIMFRGQLEFVPRLDPATIKWQEIRMSRPSEAIGAFKVMIGRPADLSDGWILMAQTSAGWRLDLSRTIAALVAMNVADAPWRNAVVQRAIDGVRSGKLNSADAVTDALVLQTPAPRSGVTAADRSSPEGAIVALNGAIESGDIATVADSFRFLGESDDGAARRQLARRAVADQKLSKALLAKFGPDQGRRLVSSCGLRERWLDIYQNMSWVVDGDVARASLDQNGHVQRYDVTKRMIRAVGVWRIELPPTNVGQWHRPKTENEKASERWNANRPRRENDMLAHLDRYPTPGSVIDALNAGPSADRASSRQEQAREADRQVAEARQKLATQPAATTEEAFDQQMGLVVRELGVALGHEDAAKAATFYIADGDDGAYVVARERRALAIHRLVEAAVQQVDSRAPMAVGNLLDVADDLYGLAMIEWKIQGDRATATHSQGVQWAPTLRRIDGQWKIDVTDETDGNPRQAAVRALNETKEIESLTRDVDALKFKTLCQFKAAVINSGIKGANRPT